jgi:phosphoglycolate phosphatase-like HAD superfamily hydrolase
VSGRPLAIVDIDGVVADVRHRLGHLDRRPKDWDAFFAAAGDDAVHPEGAAIVERLAEDHDVVFVTGRPSRLRDVTTRWLEANGFGGHRLVMRADGDRRPAAVAKLELIRDLAAVHDVAVVVDDEPAVLEAVRAAGLPAFAAEWERR